MPKGASFRKLTPDEIRNATMHHWPRFQKITIIPFSFDLSIIPQHIKESALNLFSQTVFDPLNSDSINWLQKVLHEWEESCEYAIKFKYVEEIKTNFFGGIVIANCDKLKDANGYWQRVFNSSGEFQFGLVCIPSRYYDSTGKLIAYNVRTISHEIGHAIGLDHLHDVESVRVFLQNTPEGMGYSVMPYLHEIKSNVSLCVDMDVCYNSSYAIMPGPFDAQMCQAIYGEDSLFFFKPGKLEEMQNYAWGGATIGYTLGIRSAMEYLFTRLGNNKTNASLKVLAIYYSVVLVQLLYQSDASDYSSLYKQVQQLMIPLGSELCAITLDLLAEYLQQKNYMLAKTLGMAAASLKIMVLGRGLSDAAQESFHMTWNYGSAILSGIASYGIVSTFGKYVINSFIGPANENHIEDVKKVPQQGFISSLWSFFDTKQPERDLVIVNDSEEPKLWAIENN